MSSFHCFQLQHRFSYAWVVHLQSLFRARRGRKRTPATISKTVTRRQSQITDFLTRSLFREEELLLAQVSPHSRRAPCGYRPVIRFHFEGYEERSYQWHRQTFFRDANSFSTLNSSLNTCHLVELLCKPAGPFWCPEGQCSYPISIVEQLVL